MHHLLAPFRFLAAAGVSAVLLAALPGMSAAATPSSGRPAVVAARMEMTVVQSAGHGHGGGGGGGGGGSSTPTGYDVSYPQCGRTLPTNVLFGIVGVNDGIVYSPNPCLADEILWAESSQANQAQLYANTADPGPDLSSYWPLGQSANNVKCAATDPNSDNCNFLYGWFAAENSYQTAVDTYTGLAFSKPAAKVSAATWWLDVETANSWQTDVTRNVWALRGAVDFLSSAGVENIGFYSTASMWQTITGGDITTFKANANWLPGARTERAAQRNCSGSGFTGGTIVLTQYLSGGFDADYQCIS